MALGLYLMMGGNAFIYYGEEIGMKGSGKDENKRAPMYWSDQPDCLGPPDMDPITMKYDSLEKQIQDEDSIYSYVKNVLSIRNQYPVIARGEIVVDDTLTTDSLAVFEKKKNGLDSVLIVINLSREAQTISLFEYTNLVSQVNTGREPSHMNGNHLEIPGYGMAVFTK
jgi:glycosidase